MVTNLARPFDEEFVRGAGAGDFLSALGDKHYDAVIDAGRLGEHAIERVVDK